MVDKLKPFIPHGIAFIIMLGLVWIYAFPSLQGKEVEKHDIVQSTGMGKMVRDYYEQTGDQALWNPAMFSGMPAFQTGTKYPSNFISRVEVPVFKLDFLLTYDTGIMLALLVGFYILMIALGVSPWLGVVGAIAFGFSTFWLVSLDAGHMGKLRAIGYMAPVIAGVLTAFRGRLLTGAAVTMLFLGLQINANHFQITYYLMLIVMAIGLAYAIKFIRENKVAQLLKTLGILFLAAFIAVGPNVSRLWSTYTYGQETIRGGTSELSAKQAQTSGGLDKEYAMAWSNGIWETMTLLVPDFQGGASATALGESSNLAKALKKRGVTGRNLRQTLENVPTYWGKQSFTGGPYYFGAIVIFLFIFGMFFIKDMTRWWIFGITLLAIMLSWGRHFPALTYTFFDYMPMYNKFRTPSMLLTIAALMMPLLGFLAVDKIVKGAFKKDDALKALKYALYITGGILVLVILGSFIMNVSSPNDDALAARGWPMDVILDDRRQLMRMSAIKSLVFVGLAWFLLHRFINGQWSKALLIGGLGVLICADLWMEGFKYLSHDDFKPKRQLEANYAPNQADQVILRDNDPHFRVFNLTASPFNDAITSYKHKSIGGYHAAKLIRYQDVIEQHLSQNNIKVLNMLNTKYIIAPNRQTNAPEAQVNNGALGNAWFVSQVTKMDNADREIAALNNINTATEAVYDNRYSAYMSGFTSGNNPSSSIRLTQYDPRHMVYEANVSGGEHFAVFSEIYYEGSGEDWKAYLDGQPVEHIRVNYILRGMRVPDGTHTIAFKFEPSSYLKGERISLWFSILFTLILIGVVVYNVRMKA